MSSAIAIEDHGVIGDLNTVALVGMNGSIDFLCFPYFDSPSVFAALLDSERGGRFCIEPQVDNARASQMYLPDTNVLLTRFLSHQGVAEIQDFMEVEPAGRAHSLVRQVKAIRGDLEMHVHCAPRFDYGRAEHRVDRQDGSIVFLPEAGATPALRLRHSVPVDIDGPDAVASFRLGPGESAEFCLEQASLSRAGGDIAFGAAWVDRASRATRDYWHDWIGRCRYEGRWREVVRRSALVLKLLTSRTHGSIVAAPTFGLPETIGGERNWDYRYCWIRDAAFTVYALMRLGYMEEAHAFNQWIEERCTDIAEGPPLQVMYGLSGRAALDEEVLEHFRGYRGSTPVRIGNAAHTQLQLDLFGELLDSIYLYNKHGEPISWDLWSRLVPVVDWVCDNWKRPDRGIWEIRDEPRAFTTSRVMCWVAIDRALRIARKRSFPAPRERWLTVRDEIYRDVYDNCWDARPGAFPQVCGGNAVDASALLMPLVKFIGATDPRWLGTLDAIQRDLVEDSLVYRYKAPDGLEGVEGSFSVCTFWYVECLSRAGQADRARLVFEKMLGYANHVGLYAEQLGPRGEHLGNFPQALTHLSLVSAAYDLDSVLDGVARGNGRDQGQG